MLDVTPRSLWANGFFVPAYNDTMVLTEEAVDILEGAVGGFRVKEVDYWHERGVEYSPDDVESPLESLNTDRSDLDNCWME